MKAMKDRILIKCDNEEQQKHLNNLMKMIREMNESGMKMSLIENCENLHDPSIKSISVSFIPWSDKNE